MVSDTAVTRHGQRCGRRCRRRRRCAGRDAIYTICETVDATRQTVGRVVNSTQRRHYYGCVIARSASRSAHNGEPYRQYGRICCDRLSALLCSLDKFPLVHGGSDSTGGRAARRWTGRMDGRKGERRPSGEYRTNSSVVRSRAQTIVLPSSRQHVPRPRPTRGHRSPAGASPSRSLARPPGRPACRRRPSARQPRLAIRWLHVQDPPRSASPSTRRRLAEVVCRRNSRIYDNQPAFPSVCSSIRSSRMSIRRSFRCPFVCPSVRSCVRVSVRRSNVRSSVRPSSRPPACTFVSPCVRPFVQMFDRLNVRPSQLSVPTSYRPSLWPIQCPSQPPTVHPYGQSNVRSCDCLPVRPCFGPFVRSSSVHQPVHLSVRLSVHSCVRPSVRPFICLSVRSFISSITSTYSLHLPAFSLPDGSFTEQQCVRGQIHLSASFPLVASKPIGTSVTVGAVVKVWQAGGGQFLRWSGWHERRIGRSGTV